MLDVSKRTARASLGRDLVTEPWTRRKGIRTTMKKIHVMGIAFTAIFVFSIIGASDASVLSLWDECVEVNLLIEVGLFNDNNCVTLGGTEDWEWLEIKAKTAVDSLLGELIMTSGPVKIDCQGFADGTVGPGNENEVILLLNEEEREVTEANPITCELLEGGLFCGTPVLASPDNLPWLTLLEGANDLLESGGTGNPGWLIVCDGNPKSENLCSREDWLLTVENLLTELEVDFGFKPLEGFTCTNSLAKEGKIEGTVSILLTSGTGALQAM
jgi:hypothetical protein